MKQCPFNKEIAQGQNDVMEDELGREFNVHHVTVLLAFPKTWKLESNKIYIISGDFVVSL